MRYMLLGLLAAALLFAQTGSGYTAPRLVCSQTDQEVKAACLHGEERQVCLQMDEQIVRKVLLQTAVKFPLLRWKSWPLKLHSHGSHVSLLAWKQSWPNHPRKPSAIKCASATAPVHAVNLRHAVTSAALPPKPTR